MSWLSQFWHDITDLKLQSPIYTISEAELAERKATSILRKCSKKLDKALEELKSLPPLPAELRGILERASQTLRETHQ